MVLGIAALVGLFLVALQVLVGMFANFGTSPFAHSPRWLLINLFFAGSTLAAVECRAPRCCAPSATAA